MIINILKGLTNTLYIILALLFGIIYVPVIALLLVLGVCLIIVLMTMVILFIPFYYIYYVIKNKTFKGFVSSFDDLGKEK
jgi:hypothetical protein